MTNIPQVCLPVKAMVWFLPQAAATITSSPRPSTSFGASNRLVSPWPNWPFSLRPEKVQRQKFISLSLVVFFYENISLLTNCYYMEEHTHTHTHIYIRGVTVNIFVPNRFGTGLSVRDACVPNGYSIFFIDFFQEIQIINGVLTVFDVAWQIAV